MTTLSEIVKVERRFSLSARVDTDLNGTPPLTGYVLQPSVRKSLEAMLSGISEGSRRAFTWTGPFGGGKSCAALLVANLVAGGKKQRLLAEQIVGADLAEQFSTAFPGRGRNWKVLALTGRRTSLTQALWAAAAETFGWAADQWDGDADHVDLIARLEGEARKGGLLVLVDELGKFLEHAVGTGDDVHILQDLAERATRSAGRLVVVGILHQSFEQYASKSHRGSRDEWAKVQGRFQNVPFVAQPDEVAALIARAIASTEKPEHAQNLAHSVSEAVSRRRPVDVEPLTEVLADAWPLHPVTTLLLGPVSRQRFAQNERSVFGFLSSGEPYAFQSFLSSTPAASKEVYGPDRLWDYLVANFGTAMSSGPDGHRISLAFEAIERAALQGDLAERLTKAAAIIELFRNGSGLSVGDDILFLCAPEVDRSTLSSTIDELVNRAILIRQPRLGGYALFAGSDFDLDEAMATTASDLDEQSLLDLPTKLGVGPIAAKSHYFQTGALRTFEVVLQLTAEVPVNLVDWAKATAARIGRRGTKASGIVVLLVPELTMSTDDADSIASALAEALEQDLCIAAVAIGGNMRDLKENAADLDAIDRIEASHPRIEGDRIARRELTARRAMTTDAVRDGMIEGLASSRWWALGRRRPDLDGKGTTFVASEVSSKAFHAAPVIKSELLYRDKPSSSAMAGLRSLLYAMVSHESEGDLGFENYPVERGHYLTVLMSLGLHREVDGRWRFSAPDAEGQGASLEPAWRLLSASVVNLDQLFNTWARRPYGLKRGVMPVLAMAYILAHRTQVAVYVDGIYQAAIDDVFADRMLQTSPTIELRHISRSERDLRFTRSLSSLLSNERYEVPPEALPIASALFQRFKSLPIWAQRTSQLDETTRRIRDVVLKANDPEALLFQDLASLVKEEPDPALAIVRALKISEEAYSGMLDDIRKRFAEFLGVDADTFEGVGLRAATASGVTGDLRLDAFIMRAGAFEGGNGNVEELVSLLVHKPPKSWSDREQEQAMFELARLTRRFRDAEAFAAVQGRAPTAKAVSVMVGMDPAERPLFQSFHVTDDELIEADAIAEKLIAQLAERDLRSTMSLAVAARILERLSLRSEQENS